MLCGFVVCGASQLPSFTAAEGVALLSLTRWAALFAAPPSAADWKELLLPLTALTMEDCGAFLSLSASSCADLFWLGWGI